MKDDTFDYLKRLHGARMKLLTKEYQKVLDRCFAKGIKGSDAKKIADIKTGYLTNFIKRSPSHQMYMEEIKTRQQKNMIDWQELYLANYS